MSLNTFIIYCNYTLIVLYLQNSNVNTLEIAAGICSAIQGLMIAVLLMKHKDKKSAFLVRLKLVYKIMYTKGPRVIKLKHSSSF